MYKSKELILAVLKKYIIAFICFLTWSNLNSLNEDYK